jgi:osmotically-inducible protein OsmY
MRKVYEAVGVAILIAVGMGVAVAQTPQADQPAAGAGQNQMQSQELSSQGESALANKVVHAIVMLPYYGVYDNIGFNLSGRTVTLTGQVLRSSLKPDAERAVKKVEGVDKVINQIEVLPPGPLDMRIREQVKQAIYGYGPFLKYANQPNPPIRIIVKSARLTLTGVVDNETDKNLCTMRANQVSDVLSVTNNLRVVKQ